MESQLEQTATGIETGATAVVEPEQPGTSAHPPVEELVVEDLLIEDVSIDGMCGVY